MKRLFLAIALTLGALVGVPATAQASGCTFTGAVSSKWDVAGNWDCGYVPSKYVDAYIDAPVITPDCSPYALSGQWICPEARTVVIDERGSITGGELEATEIVLNGGSIVTLGFNAQMFRFNSGSITNSEFGVEVMEFRSGTISDSATMARRLNWPGGELIGSLEAGQVFLSGASNTVIYDGILKAVKVTFEDAGDVASPPRLLVGNNEDQVALVTGIAEFAGDWSVEEYQGDVGWQATYVRLPKAGTDVHVTDVMWEVTDVAVSPGSVVRVSGGEFKPKVDAKVGTKAVFACTATLTKACDGTAFDIESAGRLETGAPVSGGTYSRPTEVVLPAHWALSRVIWAHLGGDVRNDKTWDRAYRASVEPLALGSQAPPTYALFEWMGGRVNGVSFPGGGPTRPLVGVDLDILGSEERLRIGNLNIGSDATLSSRESVYVDCDATLLVEASGSMLQDASSYLGGCNDSSIVRNEGLWKALEGQGTARLAETKFVSSGTLDLTEAVLEVSDLVDARIQGRMLLAFGDPSGHVYVTDGISIRLGSPAGDPLTIAVRTTGGSGVPGGTVPVDGDSLRVFDYETAPAVSGPVRVDPATIVPGLQWTIDFDAGGMQLVARQGLTVTAPIRTNNSIPCTAPCTLTVSKGTAYDVSWKISASGVVPDLRATFVLPARTSVVRATNMQCTGQGTVSCVVGKVGVQGASKTVALRLRSAKVGRYALTGAMSGQGLAGDLSMQGATVVVR